MAVWRITPTGLAGLAFGLLLSRLDLAGDPALLPYGLVLAATIYGGSGIIYGAIAGGSIGLVIYGHAVQLLGFLLYSFLVNLVYRSPWMKRRLSSAGTYPHLIVSYLITASFEFVASLSIASAPLSLLYSSILSGVVTSFAFIMVGAMSALASFRAWDRRIEYSAFVSGVAECGIREQVCYIGTVGLFVIAALATVPVGSTSLGYLVAFSASALLGFAFGPGAGAMGGCLAGVGLVISDYYHVLAAICCCFLGMVAGTLRMRGLRSAALGAWLGGMGVAFLVERLSHDAGKSILLASSFGSASLALLGPEVERLLRTRGMVECADRADGVGSFRSDPELVSIGEQLRLLINAFGSLAEAFSGADEEYRAASSDGANFLMQAVQSRLCQTCGRRRNCWGGAFYLTYTAFLDLFAKAEMVLHDRVDSDTEPSIPFEDLPKHLQECCANAHRLADSAILVLRESKEEVLVREEDARTRRVVASQFRDLLEVVRDAVSECRDELVSRRANVDRLVRFDVEYAIYRLAKPDNLVSGDSGLVHMLPGGRTLIVLGDGMGSGEDAAAESRCATSMLRDLMLADISLGSAIKIINRFMMLRRDDDRFSTLDVAVIDRVEGVVEFTKVGSCPSYIRSSSGVTKIVSHSLPVGILDTVDFETIRCHIDRGDMIVMVSDGVLDGGRTSDDEVDWIEQYLGETQIDDPAELANSVARRVRAESRYEMSDDKTIIVLQIADRARRGKAARMRRNRDEVVRTRVVS